MRLPTLLLTAGLLSVVGPCLPAKILAVLPFPGKSHFIFHWSVFKALTDAGHQVVEYSPFTPSITMKNYSHVEIHSQLKQNLGTMSHDQLVKMFAVTKSVFGFKSIQALILQVCEDTFNDKNVQKLLQSNEHFDLVFIESNFGQESMAVFGHKFRTPVLSLYTNGPAPSHKLVAGNSLSLASVPDNSPLVITDQMTLMERMSNSLLIATKLVFYSLFHLPQHERLIKEYYSKSVPPLPDMIKNISIYFTNSHPAVEYIQPYTPNIIPVAGINISPGRTSLPQDLQEFMDGATDGVIYFSLGTFVPVHSLPKETLQIFTSVFRTLKQKVLWKINAETLPGLSNNVKLSKWFPQPGILAHPNCVLFMTHGGLFSLYEALYAGVPTVGMPFFGDQPFNIRFSEHRGFGVKLDFHTLSEQSLTTALHTVLKNTSYRENAQRLSRVFRERPVSPADSVVFWTEYVLRHAGAHHLRPASTQLSWYQLCLLDVLAVVLLPTVAVVVLLYIIARRTLRKLWSRSGEEKPVPAKKKKNN